MLRLLIGLFFSVYSVSLLQAQSYIGQCFDVNGEYINGYLDPFSYQPRDFLELTFNSDGFEKGAYYEKNGLRFDGWVQYDEEYIKYKKGKSDKPKKLKADEVSAILIGVDSFFVEQDFQVLRGVGLMTVTEPNFLQYIGENEGYVFARHYLYTSALGQLYVNASPVVVTYQYLKKGTTIWKPIERNGEKFEVFCKDVFKDVKPIMLKVDAGQLGIKKSKFKSVFKTVREVKSKVRAGQFEVAGKNGVLSSVSNDDIYSQIQIALYWNKYKHAEDILFDRFWNEVNSKEESEFYAKVSAVTDSIWDLSYFKNGVKLYDVQYSHFFPNRLNGSLVSYSKTGDTLSVVTFENDKRLDEKYYHSNGNLNLAFRRFSQTEGGDKYLERSIYAHNDREGNNLIPEDSMECKVLIENAFDDTSVEYSYKNKQWNGVRYIYPDVSFMQISDLNDEYYINNLRNKFEDNISGGYTKFREAIARNVDGVVMIAIRLSAKGEILKAERANSLFYEIDDAIDVFISKELLSKGNRYKKDRPYKVGKEKVAVEFVIPVVFNVNRFYKKPNMYQNNYWMINDHYNFAPPVVIPSYHVPRF